MSSLNDNEMKRVKMFANDESKYKMQAVTKLESLK